MAQKADSKSVGLIAYGFESHLRHHYRGVAQLGRPPALGAGCRRFESCHPDQPIGN